MFRHQLIKVGSLVRWHEFTGIVTRVDPDERGDKEEVEVAWLDGSKHNARTRFLEVINESR